MICKAPLVSIIITSYNRAQWISKTIQSALNQNYKNLEIIISDNASTDDTDNIINEFCNDTRIKYFKNPVNIGMLANFKLATEKLATGELVTYVSSDDYLVNNNFISEAVSKFISFNNLVVFSAISKSLFINTNEEKHNPAYLYKTEQQLLNKILPGKSVFLAFQFMHLLNFGGSVFIRKMLIKYDMFREPNTTYSDLQIILLLALEGDFYLSDKISYIQSFHNENTSLAYADAKKSLLNLSFADVPFEEAKKIRFLADDELKKWHFNMIRPFVINDMTILIKKDKLEYKYYMQNIELKYPEIFLSIKKDKKLQLLNVVFSNKILHDAYKLAKQIKYAKV